jgi:DNA-directed RNA polymerase specialized sigma24 family protein
VKKRTPIRRILPYPHSENRREVALLRRDPGALVARYQEMIKQIVFNFVARGMFRSSDIEEIIQSVNLELLLKIPVIRQQYNGTTLLKTYISSIIRNICLRLKQKQDTNPGTVVLDEEVVADPSSIETGLILEGEIERLRLIINMFDRQMSKLLLALKIYYQIPINPEELISWYPHSNSTTRARLGELFARPSKRYSPQHVYDVVAPLINDLEGKANTPDAFRKWSVEKIDEIIDLLNGSAGSHQYDRDSLHELVEDFFSPFLLKK